MSATITRYVLVDRSDQEGDYEYEQWPAGRSIGNMSLPVEAYGPVYRQALRHAQITMALGELRKARELLTLAECPLALAKVRRALKSAEGAERHARASRRPAIRRKAPKASYDRRHTR